MNRGFILNTVAAILYNGLTGILIQFQNLKMYYYALFLVTGLHLIFLFLSTLAKIRKFEMVGFTGYSILSVLLVHVIFWLMFINIP